jgi:fumarate hydratase, class II
VLCETANQVAARVFGNDATIAYACSQGILELNTYLPVIGDALLESAHLLARTCAVLTTKLVDGLRADEERCRRNAEHTPALATVLAPIIGYDRAAAIVREALASGRSILEVARAHGYTDAQLDPSTMV